MRRIRARVVDHSTPNKNCSTPNAAHSCTVVDHSTPSKNCSTPNAAHSRTVVDHSASSKICSTLSKDCPVGHPFHSTPKEPNRRRTQRIRAQWLIRRRRRPTAVVLRLNDRHPMMALSRT
jgi:hypothetical protein